MIQKGHWKGHYSFSDERMNKIRGFARTNFEIDILKVENNAFSGTVKDDLDTGGTEGIGEVNGKVKGDLIEFVKRMPVMTLLVDKKGNRKTFNRKHRPIYYTGTFSPDGKTIMGSWKFRFGFIWIGIVPVPVRASKGVWMMTINFE